MEQWTTRIELFDVDDKELTNLSNTMKQNQSLTELIIRSERLTVQSYLTLIEVAEACKSLLTLEFDKILPKSPEDQEFLNWAGVCVGMFDEVIKFQLASHLNK